MKCPFELPVAKKPDFDFGKTGLYRVESANTLFLSFSLKEDEVDYIVQAINSHEKLVDLAKDLEHGLRYLRQTKAEPYGFGIDRLEKKLQALGEIKSNEDSNTK